MPRQKKTAHVAEKVEHRLAGLKAIDPNLDLGEGCNIMVIQDPIDQLRDRVNAYPDSKSRANSAKSLKGLSNRLTQNRTAGRSQSLEGLRPTSTGFSTSCG
jgi:hypothetical protein